MPEKPLCNLTVAYVDIKAVRALNLVDLADIIQVVQRDEFDIVLDQRFDRRSTHTDEETVIEVYASGLLTYRLRYLPFIIEYQEVATGLMGQRNNFSVIDDWSSDRVKTLFYEVPGIINDLLAGRPVRSASALACHEVYAGLAGGPRDDSYLPSGEQYRMDISFPLMEFFGWDFYGELTSGGCLLDLPLIGDVFGWLTREEIARAHALMSSRYQDLVDYRNIDADIPILYGWLTEALARGTDLVGCVNWYPIHDIHETTEWAEER